MREPLNPSIEVRDVTFSYRGRAPVLNRISFACARGTITGVLGPNGSGKTTLIKNVAGLLRPDDGCVVIEEQSLLHMAPRERARILAYVPQETHVPFPFTAFELVLMGRAPHLKPLSFESARDVDEARAAMSATDTARFAARSVQELSGGERQRVMLARAFAQRPRVMLLDEPTASLDIAHQVLLYSLLVERCAAEGLTVIAAMHDINLAARFCHRIVLLDDGSMAGEGTPAEVLTADNLEAVFKIALSVSACGRGEAPVVLPAR